MPKGPTNHPTRSDIDVLDLQPGVTSELAVAYTKEVQGTQRRKEKKRKGISSVHNGRLESICADTRCFCEALLFINTMSKDALKLF